MTYTLLAADQRRHVLGVATASRSLAVGHGVPAIDVSTGAVASQAWTNRALRGVVLESMRAGGSAADAIRQAIDGDDGRDYRQVGAISLAGDTAHYTGSRATDWAGVRTGVGLLAMGNYLKSHHVLDAMIDAAQRSVDDVPTSQPTDSFDVNGRPTARQLPQPVVQHAVRLLRGLVAAELAGGERRGQQSAVLLVASTARDGTAPLDRDADIDLRVDDDPEPLLVLDRLVRIRCWHDDSPAPSSLQELGVRLGIDRSATQRG